VFAHKTSRLAASVAIVAFATLAAAGEPRFREDGPNADVFGRAQGYPHCTGLEYTRNARCLVGALSNFDALFPARVIAAPASAAPLKRAAGEPAIRYTFNGEARTLDDYLDRHSVTGFLVAKDDAILVERYQYGRTDTQRLASFSMAKSVTGLLVGLALRDGAIASIDDRADRYVRGLEGTEFGATPIKALLQMSSGVAFREDYADTSSDIYTLASLTLGQDPGGSLAAVKRFNARRAPPSQVFSYSSADSLVLGLVLAAATGRPVAQYASEKLWMPLGAEADAAWIVDGTGQEITFAYISAVLRDWARLGLMIAHDGLWQGREVVPRDWIVAATSGAPGTSGPPNYGYQFWLLPGDHRKSEMRGLRGQHVLIDPREKLVLVQTSLSGDRSTAQELYALWRALPSQVGQR
jgi:CubicO group peptidase (beta-lactamase class C family)